MFDVLHQLIDKVHGWRSEEDRVNAHTAVDEYRAEQEGDPATPTEDPADTTDAADTGVNTGAKTGQHEKSDSLFTPSGDKSSK